VASSEDMVECNLWGQRKMTLADRQPDVGFRIARMA